MDECVLDAEDHRQRVPPWWYNHPLLVLKQAFAIILYAWLTGWRPQAFLRWTSQFQHLIHAGAGAHRICCFGVSPHIVWEVTSKCNLNCIHCHASGGKPSPDELSTEEGLALIDQLAQSGIQTLVFSGGEPLLRPDLVELIAHARSKGFTLFLATNGTLISNSVANLLRQYDVGVVIGLDSMNPAVHDAIRGVEGAYQSVIAGIERCIAAGLYVHLNIVASRRTLNELERIIEYGNTLGVYSYFIYNLVPSGRGEALRADTLGADELQALFELLLGMQREVTGILIPVAAPEYWAYTLQRRGLRDKRLVGFVAQFLGGCLADEDKGMVYIKPDGAVWPCPFLPVWVGNVKEERFADLRARLQALRLGYARAAQDACTGCEYAAVCGGCKSRMMMISDEYTCPVRGRSRSRKGEPS